MISPGIQLKKICVEKLPTDSQSKCVICQENKNEAPVAYEKGKQRILEVATLRKDVVFERLTKFGADFVYHTGNKCYKKYTREKSVQNVLSAETNTTSIEQYESMETAYDSKCVVCNCQSHNGTFQKYRISDPIRAKKFLDAKLFFKDDVYNRTTILLCTNDILQASLYCHKNCIRSYLRSYEKGGTEITAPKEDLKKTVIINYFKTLIPQLKNGVGFSLSDIRNNIGIIHEIDISNQYIQRCILDEFGDQIRLAGSTDANKSTLIFHSTLRVEDVIDFLRGKDETRDCAKKLKKSFKNVDFGMSNEFSDATNIRKAWYNTKIPTPVLTFFAELYNFKISDFEEVARPLEVNEIEVNDDNKMSPSKRLKITALFQIMYYILNNGTQRTPLHVMNGLAVHDASRNSILIKSLNHLGMSVSYDEVLRYRNDLARYTVLMARKENVPLPSHFDVNMFTTAAFDNFDHNESTFTGSGSSHDTVSVLFQDKSELELKKPKLSEVSMRHGDRTFRLELNCQKLLEYQTPSKIIELPENYVACENVMTMNPELYNLVKKKEFAWEICRFYPKLQNENSENEKQVVPSWSAFNTIFSEEERSTQVIGFMPIIPRPVTEYATVYTALHNFKNILGQLKQSKLPVTCDEGVYRIARHIMLLHPEEFSDIVLLLGPFHLAKIMLACIGKYLKGSGADVIFMECSVFGPNVAESVLNGTNYARSLKAFVLLSETLRRLQLREFFKRNDINNYSAEIKKLGELRQCFVNKDFEKCRTIFVEYSKLQNNLQSDFEKFIDLRRSESELFKYWDNVIYMISLVKDIVRADRERAWLLHVPTFRKIEPIFAALDRTNYLRWGSMYFEDMLKLDTTAPEVYGQFLKGKFSVRRSARCFSAVGADLCLEQSINKSKKSTNGVIGKTRNKYFVTEWELVYHEILAVSNLYRDVTKVTHNSNYELTHHEYTESETKQMEDHIDTMERYILGIGNPFADGANILINITTHQEVPEEFKSKILDVVKIGNTNLKTYRFHLLNYNKNLFT